MTQVRVNIRSAVNTKTIRQEKRNGRDVIVVPSATLPDDIVMNGIFYPAAEIAKSFMSLERTPAPLGHPTLNGQFISASDPEAINTFYAGAWNENVRQESGRVLLDKIIDIEVANRTDNGKKLIAAINAGGSIHTSTGLLCEVEEVANKAEYKRSAKNMYFDHDAILLNEEGAATPDQGVGMLVNGQTIEVVNSDLSNPYDDEINYAGTRLVEALERKRSASVWEKVKTAIIEAVTPEREPVKNRKDNAMNAEQEKQLAGLSVAVNTLSESVAKLVALDTTALVNAAVTTAVKPLLDTVANAAAAAAAKDEEEKDGLVKTVVKANLLSEPVAKELTLNALRELAKTAKPGTAAPLNNAFNGNAQDEFADYDMNKVMEAK